ncbi:MAG: aldose 1-epimerase family protein, partial [Anaerolineales bacterium]|nr:aldose 1-epimerase family protein [Anaerolineales bacterium]
MNIGGKAYTREQVLERVGQIRQLGGTRHIVLDEGRAKGVSAIDVNTGSGFQFSIIPDRGLDISAAT